MPKKLVKQASPEDFTPPEADDIDRRLAQLRFADPALTLEKLAGSVGLSRDAVRKRLNGPGYKAIIGRLNADLFAQVREAQALAMSNMLQYLKDTDSERGFDASKLFVSPLAQAPQALPAAPAEEPSFYDPDGKE